MHSRAELVILAAVAVATGGCIREYQPPALYEAHASVQLRSVLHTQLGPLVNEEALIDGSAVTYAETADAVRTTSVRVRPQPTHYQFHAEFSHSETRWETQTSYVTQTYVCGSRQFGVQYCTSERPEIRTVPVLVPVSDGGCDAHFEQTPLPGAVYLVQYELFADAMCQVTCQRLVRGADGALLATECGPGEPPTSEEVPPADIAIEPALAPEAEPTSGGEAPIPPGASAVGAPD